MTLLPITGRQGLRSPQSFITPLRSPLRSVSMLSADLRNRCLLFGNQSTHYMYMSPRPIHGRQARRCRRHVERLQLRRSRARSWPSAAMESLKIPVPSNSMIRLHGNGRSLPSMPTPRDHLAAATVQGRVYVIGGRLGRDYHRNLSTVDMYNPVTKQWTKAADLPTGRSGMTAAVIDDVIYVVGGEAPDGTFSTNEAYQPATNTWTTAAPMPTGRHGLGSAVVGHDMFVMDGGPKPGGSFTDVNEVFRPSFSQHIFIRTEERRTEPHRLPACGSGDGYAGDVRRRRCTAAGRIQPSQYHHQGADSVSVCVSQKPSSGCARIFHRSPAREVWNECSGKLRRVWTDRLDVGDVGSSWPTKAGNWATGRKMV